MHYLSFKYIFISYHIFNNYSKHYKMNKIIHTNIYYSIKNKLIYRKSFNP